MTWGREPRLATQSRITQLIGQMGSARPEHRAPENLVRERLEVLGIARRHLPLGLGQLAVLVDPAKDPAVVEAGHALVRGEKPDLSSAARSSCRCMRRGLDARVLARYQLIGRESCVCGSC